MKRRWIIRGFSIALLLLVLGIWVRGYYYDAVLGYQFDSAYILCINKTGQVNFHYLSGIRAFPHLGWLWGQRPINHRVYYQPGRRYFLGFELIQNSEPGTPSAPAYSYSKIGVPHWFLAVTSATVLYLLWRKTRPKRFSRAFPVEATTDHQTKDPTTDH